MKKIYIAGPDVFEPDSIEIGEKYSNICTKYGYKGLYPLDNVVDFNQEKREIAKDIFLANKELIKECDIVIANLNVFRGKEPDSGTVWECGYAYGLGKKVYGYINSTAPYITQFNKSEKRADGDIFRDNWGRMIEDFDYPLNLMISCSVVKIIEGSFEDAIKYVNKKQY